MSIGRMNFLIQQKNAEVDRRTERQNIPRRVANLEEQVAELIRDRDAGTAPTSGDLDSLVGPMIKRMLAMMSDAHEEARKVVIDVEDMRLSLSWPREVHHFYQIVWALTPLSGKSIQLAGSFVSDGEDARAAAWSTWRRARSKIAALSSPIRELTHVEVLAAVFNRPTTRDAT